MAKKKKQKRISQSQQAEIAQRELQKGNAKQALKYAKACYRLDPSEPVRSLLQRALLSRGKDLLARAMHEPARAVVVELDELGEVAAEYEADANRLRVLLGLRNDLESPELLADKGLRDELADQAVLLGPAATRHGAREMADAVRAALSAAETGQYDCAIELVSPIGRDSPYCDWKLFVRGLCAHYQRDEQRASTNWSRLAQDRPARRIADTLSLLMDPRRYATASGNVQARADRLIRLIETPLIGSLRVLRRKLHDPEVRSAELRAELRRFMNLHAKTEPAVAQRVANIFVQRAIQQRDDVGLAAMKRFLPTLPLDPRLNRGTALLAEFQRNLARMEEYWKAYINDLRSCEALGESQRVMATALVYNRIAAHHVEALEEAEDASGFMYCDEDYVEALERDAVTYFRKSLEVNPNSADVHLAFGRFLREREQPNEAAAAFRELGRRFPDDADSLVAVASHFVMSDEPGVAKEYAKKARTLRPRDAQTLSLVWAACLGTARQAAQQRQFRLSEAELDEAESLLESGTLDAYILYSMRAAVAFKEGNLEAAERHLQATIQQFERPTAALLIVDSQARRCKVDAQRIKVVRDRLASALKGIKNSQAAGVMAKYLHALALHQVEYPGLVSHTNQVAAYLDRSSRVKWQADHLVDACRFASLEGERQALSEKLAKRGMRLFPQHPYFHFFLGRAEMARGSSRCNYATARSAFERAIELDKQGDIPLEDSYCQIASQSLSLLEDGPPLSFGPRGPFGRGYRPDEDEDPLRDMHPAELVRLLESMPPDLQEELDRQGVSPLDAVRTILGMLGGRSP